MQNDTVTSVPLYRQLFERYRDDILHLRLMPGQRINSIAEIQAKFGVARETAKRVLHTLAEEGYIVQQAGKGSFVSDRRPVQHIWGLVFPFYNIQYEDLIFHVSRHAAALGRELRHYCDYNDYQEEIRLVGFMLKERFEAVVVIPTFDESRTGEFYSRLSPQDSPVVLLDHTMTSNDFRFVVQSYDLGVARAMSYLLEQKNGGVAFVENEVWAGRNMVLELMRETYLDIMRRRRPHHPAMALPRANAIEACALRHDGITGVLCCDDVSAIQVIGRLHEQGASVPGEFNVVSYGNTDLSRYFTPPITTVDPHNAEMARILTQLIHPENDGDADSNIIQYVVQPELVIRET